MSLDAIRSGASVRAPTAPRGARARSRGRADAAAIGAAVLALCAQPALAQLRVGCGGPYTTIQAAIDAAQPGQTVLVCPGVYNEQINFHGKAITVRSEAGAGATTISGEGLEGCVVRFDSGETRASVLQGFRITGGTAPFKYGAGVHIHNASPSVYGCIISGNIGQDYGGGVGLTGGGSPILANCVITDNYGISFVGAYAEAGTLTLLNCDVTNNAGDWLGIAAGAMGSGTIVMTNCIVWGNQRSYSFGGPILAGNIAVTYSNVQEGVLPGAGNISADPLFGSPDSPCVDAGDTSAYTVGVMVDAAGNPRAADIPSRADTGRGPWPVIDMGAHELQPAACRADFDGDRTINAQDISAFITAWLHAVTHGCP